MATQPNALRYPSSSFLAAATATATTTTTYETGCHPTPHISAPPSRSLFYTLPCQWLASVAIANWDPVAHQGYKILGVPTSVRDAHHSVELGAQIRDVLQDGDEGVSVISFSRACFV